MGMANGLQVNLVELDFLVDRSMALGLLCSVKVQVQEDVHGHAVWDCYRVLSDPSVGSLNH